MITQCDHLVVENYPVRVLLPYSTYHSSLYSCYDKSRPLCFAVRRLGRPLNFHNVAFRCGLSSARLRPPTERRRTGLLANSRGSSRRTEPALDFRNVARPMVSAPSSCALSAGWQTCLLRGSWRCSDVSSRSKPLSSFAQSAASASWASEDAVWHCKTPMSDLDPYGSCCHLMVITARSKEEERSELQSLCRILA
ncbi:hypothetical protein DFH11DRAFT_904006 [Phellopilus nigrolimitatus]|nr:hypothetical protein DFH11DRAFT_904006 [Phellopilus nigrolimitatus]